MQNQTEINLFQDEALELEQLVMPETF